MAVQYFYPTATTHFGEFLGVPNANLYSNIDEGVSTPNDNDYILGSGYATNGISRVSQFIFNFSSLSVEPSLVQVNVRYSGGVAAESSVYTSTTILTCNQIPYSQVPSFDYQKPLPPTDVFTNASADITTYYDILSLRPSYTLVGFMDIGYYVPSGQVLPIYNLEPKVKISAVEIMFSGIERAINACPLFIQGYQPTGNLTTLYTFSSNTSPSGLDLFLKTEDFHGHLDLFLKAQEPAGLNNNAPLMIKVESVPTGIDNSSGNKVVPLFTMNSSTNSGELPLFIGSPLTDTPFNSMPLIIPGPTITSVDSFLNGPGITPLVVANNFGSGNKSANLIVKNTVDTSGNMSLFLNAYGLGSGNADTTLFIAQNDGTFPASGETSLFINNGYSYTNSNTNLFINSYGTSKSGQATLFTYAVLNTDNLLVNPSYNVAIDSSDYLDIDSDSYLESEMEYDLYTDDENELVWTQEDIITALYGTSPPLFINGSAMNTNMPLFISSETRTYNNDSMNLFVQSKNSGETNQATLMLYNNAQLLESGARLFIRGNGVNDGFNFAQENASLFLARDFSGVYNTVPLYLAAPSGTTSNATLYMSGGTYSSNITNLVMPVTKGLPSGINTLYTHGF